MNKKTNELKNQRTTHEEGAKRFVNKEKEEFPDFDGSHYKQAIEKLNGDYVEKCVMCRKSIHMPGCQVYNRVQPDRQEQAKKVKPTQCFTLMMMNVYLKVSRIGLSVLLPTGAQVQYTCIQVYGSINKSKMEFATTPQSITHLS
uniref:Uncharacterized protein n=1 Tax=Glossina pallidipes TaxID=7398 RepID=A0A1A9Z2R6_GLOPL